MIAKKPTPTLFNILLLSLILASCNFLDNQKPEPKPNEENFKEIKVNNEYAIKLPDYMTENKDLNEDASLQYQNIYKETYIVVIDEPKKELISTFSTLNEYDSTKTVATNYRNIQLKMMNERMKITQKQELGLTRINGLSAEIVDLKGTAEGVKEPIAYKLAFIEGGKNVYLIMTWTLENRFDKYKDTFEHMIRSFKLVRKRTAKAPAEQTGR